MENLPLEFSKFQAQQSYTDLNQLNNIRQMGNDDKSLALRKVAEQFESMFVSLMLKSMRAANDVFAKDNPLNSFEMNFHRDMYDNQLSLNLSQSNRTGLAEALYRQMENTYLNSQTIDPAGVNSPLSNGEIDPQRLISASPYRDSIESIVQRKEDGDLLSGVKTPKEFIEAIRPYAEEIAASMGLDPKVLIAQSALETGWGEYVTRDSQGKSSFNLFNIKADSRWDGQHVQVPTIEYRDGVAERETAKFRRYDSIDESFKDYQKFLQQTRYEKALSVTANSQAYLEELQKAGYATDPNYAAKINKIMDNM